MYIHDTDILSAPPDLKRDQMHPSSRKFWVGDESGAEWKPGREGQRDVGIYLFRASHV